MRAYSCCTIGGCLIDQCRDSKKMLGMAVEEVVTRRQSFYRALNLSCIRDKFECEVDKLDNVASQAQG